MTEEEKYNKVKRDLFMAAAYFDRIEAIIGDIDLDRILNTEFKCKLRNGLKSAKILSKYNNEMLSEEKHQISFGDYCDKLHELSETLLDDVLKDK